MKLTIEEARRIQAERQRKSVKGFLIFTAIIIVALISVLILASGNSDKRVMILFPVIAVFPILWKAKKTNIYQLLRPKEFSGKVTYFSVREENKREVLTNNVGDTYKMTSSTVADIAVENESGRTVNKTFLYSNEFDTLALGDSVTLLRFIDRPVINKQ